MPKKRARARPAGAESPVDLTDLQETAEALARRQSRPVTGGDPTGMTVGEEGPVGAFGPGTPGDRIGTPGPGYDDEGGASARDVAREVLPPDRAARGSR